ncbi:MAG TPA: N-methyl-L-tryptophan oxidase [Parafilimonas sp.]|nr:N-methyl-L-tryptophan oxidase [Parafilimonas sp.]
MEIFDVIVLGLGAHGSAAVYHLSKNNIKVCGIDRFVPPHAFGSSHGQSRIIRQAYHESPMYVPLVMEAYRLWNELENVSGKKLLLKTGGLILGNEDSMVIKGAKLSAETHHVPYEYLSNKEITKRFPALKPTEDTVAVVEQSAGILFPEECIKANLKLANDNGALLLFGEAVQSINIKNNYAEVVTNKGIYETEKLIVTVGAWLNDILPELKLPLNIKRQVLFWFKSDDKQMQPFIQPEHLPVFIWEHNSPHIFYGFPDLGNGIKIAPHHEGQPIHPDLLSKEVYEDEIQQMKNILDEYFNVDARFSSSDVCMYTNTPDEHFIIDYYPSNKNIIVASPCSGHGFKFSSAMGKLLGDMVLEKELNFDISPFSINRFSRSSTA